MKYLSIVLIALIGLILSNSCTKTSPINQDNLIIGTWVQHSVSDYNTFDRKSRLEDDKPGMIFHADGSYTSRDNSGFCGTPPVHYNNFEGTWTQIDDNHIKLVYSFWGGTIKTKVIITVLDDHNLEWIKAD